MSILTEEQRQEYRDVVCNFIDEYAIYRTMPDEAPLLGKIPGTLYNWQFYLSQASLFRDINIAMSHLGLDALHDLYMERPFQIAALDTDGIAIGMGMLMVSGMYEDFNDLHMIRVRKERKEYGKQNIIEGIPKKDLPMLLVDDLMSSKNTAYNAFYRLRDEEGFDVLDTAYAVIHKNTGEEDHDKYFKMIEGTPDKLKVISLFNLSDFHIPGLTMSWK